MPKHTVHWVNDNTEICDRLDARIQLMQDYLDSKPDDFDGIAVKRFLLGQAHEQVAWYRQSIDALETGQSFLEHYLPAYNFRETEHGTEYKRDPDFPILPPLWSRPDPDDDERFDDAGETPDPRIFNLR